MSTAWCRCSSFFTCKFNFPPNSKIPSFQALTTLQINMFHNLSDQYPHLPRINRFLVLKASCTRKSTQSPASQDISHPTILYCSSPLQSQISVSHSYLIISNTQSFLRAWKIQKKEKRGTKKSTHFNHSVRALPSVMVSVHHLPSLWCVSTTLCHYGVYAPPSIMVCVHLPPSLWCVCTTFRHGVCA